MVQLLKRDPKAPSQIVKFKLPVGDGADDVSGMTALALGVSGLMLKNKYASWAALLASIVSMLNTKSTSDYRQGSGSLTFTLMGLVLLYVQMFTLPMPVPSK